MAAPIATPGAFRVKQHRQRAPQKRGDRTRERLVEGVIAFANAGRYRVSVADLARYADVHRTAVNRHFGAIHLLYRVVARSHWEHIRFPMPLVFMDEMADRRALVWALLVGEPRELS